MATIFQLSAVPVLPVWLLIILAPHWRWTRRVLASPLVAAAPALIYLALVLPRLPLLFATFASNPTLDKVASFLAGDAGATIAWVHFLAFDLLVGRWAYLDSRERGISAWIMAPVLFFIFMLGPVGFLMYLVARAVAGPRRMAMPGEANPKGVYV